VARTLNRSPQIPCKNFDVLFVTAAAYGIKLLLHSFINQQQRNEIY
jgi:hypothetical protein